MIGIDHIFIFSRKQGKEADELVDFGLTEGSSRVHTGQGTTNRKFYFDNFFLEVLWVHNEEELKSTLVKETKLYQRSLFQENAYSPFGLCLVNTDETNEIFDHASIYQPAYFPEGMSIEYINSPTFPWLFRLPFKGMQKKLDEPRVHTLGVAELTKTTFHLSTIPAMAQKIEKKSQGRIQFKAADQDLLILEFDDNRQSKEHYFKSLSLLLKY